MENERKDFQELLRKAYEKYDKNTILSRLQQAQAALDIIRFAEGSEQKKKAYDNFLKQLDYILRGAEGGSIKEDENFNLADLKSLVEKAKQANYENTEQAQEIINEIQTITKIVPGQQRK